MNLLADLAWIAVALVWVAGAVVNKRTIRRMPAGALILHGLILTAAFSLLFNPVLRSALGPHLLPDSPWLDTAGDVFQITGLAVCIWARFHIGRNWSGTVTLKEGHTLIRSGPYALVRHPIYSGLLLAVLGRAFHHGGVSSFLAFLILLVEWKRKSLMEERLMLATFGSEYERYRAEVKGLVPGVW